LGDEGAKDSLIDMYDSMKALYGFGEPVQESTRQRGVSGFLKKIVGNGPKHSFVQSKMLSKTQDSVGRSVVTIDPELSLNQIGLPKDMAWKIYAPYVQRRLRRKGISGVEAVKAIKDRADIAAMALDEELKVRPIMYSRAPAWHKFNSIGGYVKMHDGKSIAVNPLITDGQNMDFDGDTINVHVPSSEDAVNDVVKKLMPSNMLFSNAEHDKVVPQLKHETLLSLYTANKRTPSQVHEFATEKEALEAVQSGRVRMSDEVKILNNEAWNKPE
jgi:DNA-directed RNA polymerase subunit beta'